MRLIEAAFHRKGGDGLIKHLHMFDAYDFHLQTMPKNPKALLEIGVYNGGSLYMWKEYFPNTKIIGLDIDEYALQYASKDIWILIGDQSNPAFLKDVNTQFGPFDIIIDDGGHEIHQQIISFLVLFPLMSEGGCYIIEDLYTSYDDNYKGNAFYSSIDKVKDKRIKTISRGETMIKENDTTMKFLKAITDRMHPWAYKKENEELDYLERYVSSIHFHDNMCFIYKHDRGEKSLPRGESKFIGLSNKQKKQKFENRILDPNSPPVIVSQRSKNKSSS